ncbi:MAG TPA: type II toxin-antitoxin system RelE/ParE family toxin [Pseudomonas sp.]|nr:type II toxin-antitoxin system RelE/ParE family toxin [Pseudomonas sp.]
MTVATKIEYSHTFRDQLHSRFAYLARDIGEQAAQKLLTDFLDTFEARITKHPKSSPLCAEAADIGLMTYHDYIDPKRQLRIIYRTSYTDETLYCLLFLNTRQSIREALIQYCLQKN